MTLPSYSQNLGTGTATEGLDLPLCIYGLLPATALSIDPVCAAPMH